MTPRRKPAAVTHSRRRGRLILAVGAPIFVALAAGVVLLPSKPEPYRPGSDAGANGEITRKLDRDLPADAPRIRFTEAAAAAGIRFTHFQGERSIQLPEDMGSGAAWGDYDGDGDPDLYLVNESGPLTARPGGQADSAARSALYRNDGGRFTDVTEESGAGVAGIGMGAAWGDYDGDGDLDLAVTRYGTSVLFRNDGGGRFTDVSRKTGVGSETGYWAGASWADYDRDGDLDLVVCGYVRYHYDEKDARQTSLQYNAVVPFMLNPSTYGPERNLLFRNDGGVFKEVAAKAGVDNLTGRSLSATWADFDQDGWPDLYVANDISDNVMYRNKGDGTFEDISHSAWVADYRGAMGIAAGDWDNDGDVDMFVTHWIAQENALYENLAGEMPARPGEPMHFVDNADMLGLGQIALDYIGWGTSFFDVDNDGRLDLFVANGSTFQVTDDPVKLIPMKNLLFWNGGEERGFFEVGQAAGGPFDRENVGRGAAFADYDADGDLDIAVLVNGGPARLLRNDSGGENAWTRVLLRQEKGNTHAVNARLRLTSSGLTQMREIGAGSSYLSQDPPGEAHFGLGTSSRIDRMEVTWPDGTTQEFTDLPVRSTLRLVKGREIEIDAPGEPAP